jgi:methionyl-tRNA formyltransferase
MTNPQTKIIFMGTSEFSVPILMVLAKNFDVVAVVTEIDSPSGRGREVMAPPVKILAQKLGLLVFQPLSLKKNPNFCDQLKKFEPDLIVVAAYGKILPIEVLNLPKHGCLNVHPSLLPKYRGASPIQAALLNGDEITGVTIILMDEMMDAGDIVAQKTMVIEPNDNSATLSLKLSELGAELIVNTIPRFLDAGIQLIVQNDKEVTFCKKISKEDGRINWHEPVEIIANKVRAFYPWPKCYTLFNGRKLDIEMARIQAVEKANNITPGTVELIDRRVCVRCADGYLALETVKLENKKSLNIKDFVNGRRDFIGAILR